jgi:sigma-B regulation protein RsbU (phosphoserine phosphatase)
MPAPEAAGPGFAIGSFLLSSPSGTGDLVDAFRLDGRLSAFYGLDVMGHGIFSSLVAYSLHERLRALARERESGAFLSPAALVRRLNEDYANGPESKPFFSILYGILDGESGEYRLVRAGHPPVLLLPSDGGAPRRLEGGGAAIGLLDELEIAEYSGRLAPGDRLVVASDGYFEASGGRDFGASVEALLPWLDSHRGETTAGLLESLRRLALAGQPRASLGDDASLLLVERRGAAGREC